MTEITLRERLQEASERSRTYTIPPPNTDACSFFALLLGQRDWRPEIMEWSTKNRKRIEKAIRNGEFIDWRDELGASHIDMLPIYCDTELPRTRESIWHPHYSTVWRPDTFEAIVMCNGVVMAKTMTVVRAGMDTGQIIQLADMVEKLFVDEYIPEELETMKATAFGMNLPYPNLLNNVTKTIAMFKLRCKMVIARYVVGSYLNDAGAWIENASTIAQYMQTAVIPDDPEGITGLQGMELDDDPTVSAEVLADAIEKRNRRSSGTEMTSLADLGDEFV